MAALTPTTFKSSATPQVVDGRRKLSSSILLGQRSRNFESSSDYTGQPVTWGGAELSGNPGGFVERIAPAHLEADHD